MTRPAINTALLCVLAGVAVSCGPRASVPADEHSIAAAFTCDDGRKIQAVFGTGPQPGVKLSLSDGRQIVLPQVVSASGARYANSDESFVFWNKGRGAFIEERGRRTYTGCMQTK